MVVVPDFYTLFDGLMSEPSAFGFNPDLTSDGCIVDRRAGCENVEEFIWFDLVGPFEILISGFG